MKKEGAMLAETYSELKSFEDLARNFAGKELASGRDEHDRYPFGPFFEEVVEKAFSIGLFSITMPEDCGGIGQGMQALCVMLDHIAQVDASLGAIVFTNAMAQEVLTAAGRKDLLKDILSQAVSARESLIAFPSYCNPLETMPSVEAIKTSDSYRIEGSIENVALGSISARMLIPASVRGMDGYSFFLVDPAARGVSLSKPVFTLGLHACPVVDLKLSGAMGVCMGNEGEGEQYFGQASDRMHVATAAMSCGIMKGSLKEAMTYSQERFQGGWEIINWSALRIMLGEMAIQVKIAEMTLAQAASAVDLMGQGWRLCSRAAALHLGDLACTLTTDGIQALGGNGYMKDYGQEKRYRDAKQAQSLLGIVPMRKLAFVSELLKG
jgi:alkylation response protein AidB-like acyl-CoA dehydrogenase